MKEASNVQEEKAKVVGIEETLEGLEMIKEATIFVKKVAPNGINGDDLVHVVGLSQKLEVFRDGIQDISKAKEELANLDKAEVIQIVSKVYEILDELKK